MRTVAAQPGGVGPALPPLAVSVFVLAAPGLGAPGASKIVFQELVRMASEIEPAQYVTTPPPGGATTYTKQLGTTQAPSVTLKRRLDADTTLWQWHRLALAGGPDARRNAVLEMFTAPDFASGKPPVSIWNLPNAWCSKIAITGADAGSGGVAFETVEVLCDMIAPATP